ncbi:TfoX/Sxy family protein [Halovulum sp. GXIMD14793]
MAADPLLIDHARDLFAELGPIRMGRLFGGAVLYVDDAMFAMISGDGIYMKTDDALAKEYTAARSTPFSYTTKTGRRVHESDDPSPIARSRTRPKR